MQRTHTSTHRIKFIFFYINSELSDCNFFCKYTKYIYNDLKLNDLKLIYDSYTIKYIIYDIPYIYETTIANNDNIQINQCKFKQF